jgi:hypothetical protein
VELTGEVTAVVRVAVAAVRSIVMVGMVIALAGAVFPARSATLAAAWVGIRVPSEHPVIATVALRLFTAMVGVKTQPVAVPALVKSLDVKPDTASLKVAL